MDVSISIYPYLIGLRYNGVYKGVYMGYPYPNICLCRQRSCSWREVPGI